MGKVIKILLSFLSATLLALIILPIACSLLLNLPSVQDYAGRKLTGWLSGKLQTEVHVDKLRLRLFNRVTLDGLYIEDYHQDTMFYARRIVVPLQSLNPFTGRVALGRVELEQPKFYLMQDSTGRTNLKQILLKLKRERKKEKKRSLGQYPGPLYFVFSARCYYLICRFIRRAIPRSHPELPHPASASWHRSRYTWSRRASRYKPQ